MTHKEYSVWFKRDWAKAGILVSIFLFAFLFVLVKDSDFVLFLLLQRFFLHDLSLGRLLRE